MPATVSTTIAAEPLLVLRQVPVDVVAWVIAHFDRT